MDAGLDPLVEEVQRKTAIAWLTVGEAGRRGEAPAFGVWCLGIDGVLYVVTGPGEQPAPGLATAADALVTARGDHGGRIVTWPVTVGRVWPDTDEWDTVAPQLAAKRLNATGAAQATIARWANQCALVRLVPAGPAVARGASLPDGSLAAPPVDTPATNRTRRPFRLHRVRRPPR